MIGAEFAGPGVTSIIFPSEIWGDGVTCALSISDPGFDPAVPGGEKMKTLLHAGPANRLDNLECAVDKLVNELDGTFEDRA